MTARRLGHDEEGKLTPLAELARGMAGLLSLLIFVVAAGGYAGYHYFNGRIHRISLGHHSGGAAGPAGSTDYLLVGSDSRAGRNTGFGDVGGQRSDVTILAHLDADGTTTLVSFPRDTLVEIPGHGKDKLTEAMSYGGPGLLRDTIERLTGIKADHFVSIDFNGFKEMADAIGGVTVCVRPLTAAQKAQRLDNLHEKKSGWNGHVGQNKISGDQALAYVRQRYDLPDNDLDRIRRQQQFIGAVFRKATSGGVLANPVRLERLLSTATGALTVDQDTSIDDLRRLASRMRGVDPSKIRFETIPTHAPTRAENAVNDRGYILLHGLQQAVQIYDRAGLDAMLAPLRGTHSGSGGSRPAPARTPGPTSTVPPATVRVAVYNGTSVARLAARTAGALSAAGFQVVGTGTWAGGGSVATHVVYDPGRLAEARTLAAAVGGVPLRKQPGAGPTVQLVLGRDYQRVTDPKATTGAAGSSPSASPPPAPVTAASLSAACTY